MGIMIRLHEEIEKYDWHLDDTDENGLCRLVVPAVNICLAMVTTKIVALCFDDHAPVHYLMDDNYRLYYCTRNERIIEQFFPMQEYLKWKHSSFPGFPFMGYPILDNTL